MTLPRSIGEEVSPPLEEKRKRKGWGHFGVAADRDDTTVWGGGSKKGGPNGDGHPCSSAVKV